MSGGEQAGSSFLKKRTKKLLSLWFSPVRNGGATGTRQSDKKFLLLFSKRSLLLACLLFAPTAQAQEAPVTAILGGLTAAMKAGKSSPFAARVASLAPVIDRGFDLAAILQASIGPRWSGFPPQQQAALATAFRDFTVATWVANFNADDGTRFEILPDRRAAGADIVVATRIIPPAGGPTRLDFVMHETQAGWKAVDMLVDGSISRVAVQRSDFRGLIRDGNPAPLIAMLQDKAAELAR